MTFIFFVSGLILLVAGAELLIRGASGLARAARIPPLVIGLTVVAFGTSAPEFAVSLQGALAGQPGISLGNVVGSNIFNILCILGLSALISPLVVSYRLIRFDVPLMVAASVVVFLFGYDGSIGRLEGVVLFACVVGYSVRLIVQGKKETAGNGDDVQVSGRNASMLLMIAQIAGGLVMLVAGSRWLVNGAVVIAGMLGVSDLIIGLTVVAAGTSLPELAASVIASYRGERDIAVGNVVGSNLFNIFAVLGLSGALSPNGVMVDMAALRFDIPVMVAAAAACMPVFFTGSRIDRWEGGVFVLYYIAYTVYLFLAASHHRALGNFNLVMVAVVIPLTLLTVAVSVMHSLAERKRSG